jgi:sugar O-acyltransferase (sialic acid O-acetyltransferase NeuD family)
MIKETVILGYSGHGLIVAESAIDAKVNLLHYSEFNKMMINPFNLNFLGYEEAENFKGWGNEYDFILGIGDNKIREKVAKLVISRNKELLTVIHSTASISKLTQIGIGSFISKNVSINLLSSIGKFCIVNTSSVIEHECTLADSVHIAPGAVLAGNVNVGKYSFIGANAVVKQGVKIGENSIIGAGSVVINNVPNNEIWAGNPAKPLQRK